jgi:MFS family permease
MMNDRKLIYAAAFTRALATGLIGVVLGIYLAQLHFGPKEIGIVVSSGLGGAALAAFFATVIGDRWGRKTFLISLSLFAAGGGVAVLFFSEFGLVCAVAFLGMFNGMGRDRGASLIIEQAIIPATTEDQHRTKVFAWYNVIQDAGHALGALLAGLPVLIGAFWFLNKLGSLKLTMIVYAFLSLLPAFFYLFLSPRVENSKSPLSLKLSPQSKTILWKISSLFALDSLGGGFLTTALLSYFFFERFGVSVGAIGILFFGARVANAISHLGAAWLAKRIGLVNTMVFTHIPSSLLLVTVAFAPNFPVAAILFLIREGLVEMDVPTRQSYVMAMVRPEERTIASGVTHLTRLGAWAVAPSFAGLFMQGVSQAMPLIVGAGMKITYDLLLYRAFRHLKPPEEKEGRR